MSVASGSDGMVAWIKEHAVVGRTLSTSEAAQNAKLCEVLKTFLKTKAEGLIRSANGRPCMFSYQSDSTPILAKSQRVHKVHEHRTIARRGGSAADMLIEKGFLRTWDGCGESSTSAVLRDPLNLTAGKTAWCLFSGAKAFFPTFRQLSHEGVSIYHYGFDRAMYSALSTKLKQ